MDRWCASLSRAGDEDGQWSEARSQEIAHLCGKIQGVLKSKVCGADAFEMIKKTTGAGAGLKAGKRNRAQKADDKDLARREEQLNLDLPALHESYRLIKTQSLGILKLAIHSESHQRRAVFALPKRSIIQAIPPGSNDREEVLTQLQKLLKIDHVNVLALHEACEDQRCVYLIYDWPEGGLLLSHLTQYHSDVTEAHIASVIKETLAGVAAASRFGVYHHDWSLMCLFLGYKNRFSPIKVFGLGLAGVLVPLVTARNHSRAMKYFYASPELVEENYKGMTQKKLHSCDVWSVGTLLYMLFAGRPPFHGNYEEAIAKIKLRHWSFGPEFDRISKEAKDIIDKMLLRDWERRPTAADLLKHPFLGLEIGKKRQGGVVCQDALSKLDQFARETHCKQTLARLLADIGLQESAYSELEERFKQLDLDGNGVVEVTELEELGGQLNIPGLDGANVASIIAACDRNDNGTIDISEFVSALVLQLESKDERLLVKAFEKMDMNGDARITKGEIFRILRQYSGSLEAADVSNFVADMDKDTDQKVDYNEFKMLFPHIKEKDEETKTRLRNAQVDKDSQRKTWNSLMLSLDRFLKALRTAAGKLAAEHGKLQRSGGNERHIAERILELEKVFLDHILHSTEADLTKVSETKKDGKLQGLTGLNVMNMYNIHDHGGEGSWEAHESASPTSPQLPSMADVSNSAAMASAADARKARLRSNLGGDEALEGGGGKSVASKYTRRALVIRGAGSEDVQEEAKRRRRYLWLGAGEGIKHARAHLHKLPIRDSASAAAKGGQSARSDGGSTPGSSPRSQPGASPREQRASVAGGLGSARNREVGGLGAAGGAGVGGAGGADGAGAAGGAGGAGGEAAAAHDDDDGHVRYTDGEVWTTNKKTVRNMQQALVVAGGQMEAKIGLLTPEEQKARLREIARNHLNSFGFHKGPEDLTDWHAVLKYKVLRSWLPPIELMQQELGKAMDEQKVHVVDRRSAYVNGVRFLIQHVERIMFSLTEFIAWQEEGLHASWYIEEVTQPSPATRRFLPYRQGEVDENARTPRDEEDAEELAPDEEQQGLDGDDKGALRNSMVSFAEGELDASGTAHSLHPMGSMAASSNRRLDRTAVRSKRGPGKGGGKGSHTDARPRRTSSTEHEGSMSPV